MRCNQVTIFIQRFGKFVPEGYPADRQSIHVYCDDFNSVYAALSKAYAMAVNELNEYETIGVRADVSTNEFSHVDYRKMHGTIPVLKSRYEDDVNWQYEITALEMCNDYVWVYEHIGELLETIKECKGRENFVPALKERFGLNDVQIRKLSQIRLDMLTREGYETAKKKIADSNEKTKNGERDMSRYYWEARYDANKEIASLEAYFMAADHFDEIFKVMKETADADAFMKYMQDRFGFTYEQSRAVRYCSANDFVWEERVKKEKRMKQLKADIVRYERWIEEEKSKLEKKNNKDN